MASPLASACASVITAALAEEPEIDDALDEAARILDANPNMFRAYLTGLSLALATLLERADRPQDALQFVLRTSYFSEEAPYLTTSLLMEGRLSVQAGDTARAITALEKAVTLLSDPEPSLEPIAQEARETLAELLAR